MAPEMMLHQKEPCTASDIWALACTLVELYTETIVWTLDKGVNKLLALMNVLQKEETPNLENVPSFLRPALQKCFNHVPQNRPKIKQFLALLEFNYNNLL